MNQLNEKLGVIRRQKKIYLKCLEEIFDLDKRNELKNKIDELSMEEKKIVNQLIK